MRRYRVNGTVETCSGDAFDAKLLGGVHDPVPIIV
jgi:hypothetical protein